MMGVVSHIIIYILTFGLRFIEMSGSPGVGLENKFALGSC